MTSRPLYAHPHTALHHPRHSQRALSRCIADFVDRLFAFQHGLSEALRWAKEARREGRHNLVLAAIGLRKDLVTVRGLLWLILPNEAQQVHQGFSTHSPSSSPPRSASETTLRRRRRWPLAPVSRSTPSTQPCKPRYAILLALGWLGASSSCSFSLSGVPRAAR